MAVKTRKELRQENRSFWKAHIQAWEKSGFSQNEYCRRNTLKTFFIQRAAGYNL